MQLPKQYIPDNKKNEQWHLDTLNAFLEINGGSSICTSEKKKDHDNYLIASGYFDPKQYEYVTDMYGQTTPARLVNYPQIMNKLDLLAGELISQPLQYTVNVVNENAIVRKLDQKIAVAAETILRPLRREIEKVTGVEFEDEDLGEEVPEDVEQFMAMKFRDNKEKQVNIGLDFLIQKYDLKQEFKRGFYDVGVTCKEFYKVYIENGDPKCKRLDPRSMIVDISADSENINKARYAGDENYLTISEIIDIYQPDKKMVEYLEEIEGKDSSWFKEQNSTFRNYIYDDLSGLKIRVVNLQWRSITSMTYRVNENKYDLENPHYEMLKPEYKPKEGEKVITKPFTDIRFAVKIGHEKLLKWGRKPNQVRFEDNYANTSFDYFGIIKTNFNGTTLSIVDALKNIQILYNIVMFHIEVTMQRAGGKSVVYDVAQKPPNIPLEDIFYHAKNTGLILINSKIEGNQMGSYNQFGQVDFTLSAGLGQLINLKIMLEDTAEKVTGISAARAGITKPGDLVGVNERNVMQSSLVTAPLFDLHYKVVGDVLNHMANTMRIAWANEGRMANVFGDMEYQMFKIDASIALDEYGIFVENSGHEIQKKATMMQLMERFAASGNIDPLSMIKAVNADSAVEVEAIMTKGLGAVQASMLAMKERELQTTEAANQVAGAKIQVPLDVAKINSETSIKVAQINAGAKMQTESAKITNQQDMQQVDRDTALDMEMLASSGEESAEVKPVVPKKPVAKKESKSNKK